QKWAKGKEAEALAARPEMRYVDPILIQNWTSVYFNRLSDAYIAATHAADVDRMHAVKIFHDAGAPLIAGTDQGNAYVVAGYSLHEELADLVAAGLPPYAALRAATADAARCMHAEAEWGTIQVGLRADLLLLSANPLIDVAHANRRDGVVLNGTW